MQNDPTFYGGAFSEELADSVGVTISGRTKNRPVSNYQYFVK